MMSLILQLQEEATLCRNETANDIADLLEEAALALTGYSYSIALLRTGMGLSADSEDLYECLIKYRTAIERCAIIAERFRTLSAAGEDVADGIAASIRQEITP